MPPWVPLEHKSPYAREDRSVIMREDNGPLFREGDTRPWDEQTASGSWTPILTPANPWVEA